MAFTAEDLKDLFTLLEKDQQWRSQFRSLLESDLLLMLPKRFERLSGIVEQLAEAQQRAEKRLERLEATVQTLAEAQQRTEKRLEQLAEAQQRTEKRLEQVVEAQQRIEKRLERLEATVQALAEAQQRTEKRLEQLIGQVQDLVTWQRGESGHRAGERYERKLVKLAPFLFQGGEGGPTDEAFVQQRLLNELEQLPSMDEFSDEELNPFLADLIWWKGDQYLVVEASLQVNGHDVARAASRAETLRKAQVHATGMVFGQAWTGSDIRERAQSRSLLWKVGDDISPGLLEFQRLSTKASKKSTSH
ncbi:MAG: hypothetical protein ACE5JX_18995 [Acidobacteriota bacterium]